MSTTNHPRAGRSRRLPQSAGLCLAVTLMLLLGQACDSGSSGGPSFADLCIDFDPANEPSAGTVVARLSDSSTCELAEIEIVATDVSDVFAFQSVINYDPDVAGFLGFSLVDSALESDGGDVTVVAEEEVFGVVTIGATRIGSTGVNIVGEQVLIKLAFARFSFEGRTGEFELDTHCLLNSAAPPTPISNVDCSGGTLAVR